MSKVFKNIDRYTNSGKHLITIELNVKRDDLEKLPLKSHFFLLTDTDTGYLLLNLTKDKCLCLNITEVVKKDIIKSYTSLVIEGEKSIIYFRDKYKMDPSFDLLQEFLFRVYSEINFPLKFLFYLETQNTDCKNVEIVQTVEVPKNTNDQVELNCLRHLSLDLKKILDQDNSKDVTLCAYDGMSFKAHKTILRARSLVFNSMLENDTSAATDSIIEIEEIEAALLKEFLNFLYTGEKKRYNYFVEKQLYSVACSYGVLSLQDACKEDLLTRHLHENSACEMLILADEHDDDSFKAEILEFMTKNIKVIVKSSSFEYLSKNHPQLALSVTLKHVLEN